MLKQYLIVILTLFFFCPALFADQISDQDYINKLYYRNNKLALEVRKRTIDEIRNWSNTDINTTTYSFESYSYSTTGVSSSSLFRSEAKEITEWYIYKGAVMELSDFEFLNLVGDREKVEQISKIEDQKRGFRNIGGLTIGLGVAGMIGGAAASTNQSLVMTSALVMVAGFFIDAFNQSPDHYIKPDYAQDKINEYNISLKRK
jgi:hypothetical protein